MRQKPTSLELFEKAYAKIKRKRDNRVAYLGRKRARLTGRIERRFAGNPERLEQEIGIMHVDNDVWVDIADALFVEKEKTLRLKYGMDK